MDRCGVNSTARSTLARNGSMSRRASMSPDRAWNIAAPWRRFVWILGAAAAACAVLVTAARAVDEITGHWEGAVVRLNSIQTVALDIVRRPDGSLGGTHDIPDLLLFGEPLDSVRFDPPELRFRTRYGTFTARLHRGDAELTGENPNWGPPVAIHLKREPRPVLRYEKHDVSFANGRVTLAGTLYAPASPGKHTGVVVVHGSGATSRKSFEYRGLGVLLATHGVAAL